MARSSITMIQTEENEKHSMKRYRILMDEPPCEANIMTLIQNVVSYNETRVEKSNYQKLAFYMRDEQDEMVGGLYGETYWGWLFISHLWVAEALRGQGYGVELMRRAESEAVKRGCRHAFVDTTDFQAPGFYQKLGYQVFGALVDFPEGHTRYFLQKRGLQVQSA